MAIMRDIEVYSLRQVEEILGLGRSTVAVLVRSGQLRSRTVGRRRLVTRQALDAFLGQDERPSTPPGGDDHAS